MNAFLRELSWQFAAVVSEFDRGYRHRNRAQLREALIEYWEQEMSAYISDFIRSDDGDQILDAVVRRYNKPLPKVGVRYGASGYHK